MEQISKYFVIIGDNHRESVLRYLNFARENNRGHWVPYLFKP